jgi:hypothetical protein
MGLLYPAPLGGVGTGEGTLLIPEEFGLQECLGDGGATHLDERILGAPGKRMKETGTYFLPGPGLSLEQNGDIGGGDALQFLTDSLHGGCSPKDNV